MLNSKWITHIRRRDRERPAEESEAVVAPQPQPQHASDLGESMQLDSTVTLIQDDSQPQPQHALDLGESMQLDSTVTLIQDDSQPQPQHALDGGASMQIDSASTSTPTQDDTPTEETNDVKVPLRAASPLPDLQIGPARHPKKAQTRGSPYTGPQTGAPNRRSPRLQSRHAENAPQDTDESATKLIRQPDTRPISQEQLVAEVKGIYAGLVMVESKCIEVDNAQNSQNEDAPKLNNEQWQALIALHRTLLHEHHDFFLASQHPSASPALRRLASKYAMPARMWRHGIHSFLELLRHRLPHSLEHMLTFIYLAYSMMALLYETVPAFEDTWIECLGDLGRYRMAIEDEDMRDREVWTGVSRYWYSRASDKAPTTGRLYHHLAILARPEAIQQLFFYTKSLCVADPFNSARESILTLFEPIMNSEDPGVDNAFVRLHARFFTGKRADVAELNDRFLSQLDNAIARKSRQWITTGSHIAISNGNAILEYGVDSNQIYRRINPLPNDYPISGVVHEMAPDLPPSVSFFEAQELANRTDQIVFARFGDPNVLAYIFVRLAFMLCMADHPVAMAHLQDGFNFHLLTLMLNWIMKNLPDDKKIDISKFPEQPIQLPRNQDTRNAPDGDKKNDISEKNDTSKNNTSKTNQPPSPPIRPLPEHWDLRGLVWAENLFPENYFDGEVVDEQEKRLEVASFTERRKLWILYLACDLAAQGDWYKFDTEAKQFVVSPAYEKEYLLKFDSSDEDTSDEKSLPDTSKD
ncbi:hypothetical protein NKR23_g2139 [Pleurostoma richardsiae]|uniref:DNA/RNA-binding domain-containing protein n=1 Tax=Pleurostoma richardsiae TaxID=41990 RepID=A0AA38RQN0_9PEZI|nr:hypothetical protein NKR23_g2139 [Pleurostoma richardsiae]